MLSAKARDLSTQIEWQDTLYALAISQGASQKFLTRIRTVRNDLSRQWGAEILRCQFEAVDA